MPKYNIQGAKHICILYVKVAVSTFRDVERLFLLFIKLIYQFALFLKNKICFVKLFQISVVLATKTYFLELCHMQQVLY